MAPFRIFCLAFICLVAGFSQGQAQRYGKHPKDFKPFNFGFQVGMHYASYNFTQSRGINDVIGRGFETKVLDNIELKNGPGIVIGMILNYNLSDKFSLRLYPGVSLEQRDFDYFFAGDPAPTRRRVTTAYGQIPLLIQYKTPYYKQYRLYLLAGPQFNIQPSNSKRVQDNLDLLKTESTDFGITLGIGLMLYGERVKLSPELKVFIGLRDVFIRENTSHASAIKNMASQLVTLSFNFE